MSFTAIRLSISSVLTFYIIFKNSLMRTYTNQNPVRIDAKRCDAAVGGVFCFWNSLEGTFSLEPDAAFLTETQKESACQ